MLRPQQKSQFGSSICASEIPSEAAADSLAGTMQNFRSGIRGLNRNHGNHSASSSDLEEQIERRDLSQDVINNNEKVNLGVGIMSQRHGSVDQIKEKDSVDGEMPDYFISQPKKLKKKPKFVKKQQLVNGEKHLSKTSGRFNKMSGSNNGSAKKAKEGKED